MALDLEGFYIGLIEVQSPSQLIVQAAWGGMIDFSPSGMRDESEMERHLGSARGHGMSHHVSHTG